MSLVFERADITSKLYVPYPTVEGAKKTYRLPGTVLIQENEKYFLS
jgi:hypothetical protein